MTQPKREDKTMIDKEVIKKVMVKMHQLQERCKELHKGIKESLTSREVQAKLSYNSCEGNISYYACKSFYREHNDSPWYCYVDGGHKSSEDYLLEDVEKNVEKFIDEYGLKSEKEQIERLKSYLEWATSSILDYERFVDGTLWRVLVEIDEAYAKIKAKRAEEAANLLAAYNI